MALAFCFTIYIVFAINNEFDSYCRNVNQVEQCRQPGILKPWSLIY